MRKLVIILLALMATSFGAISFADASPRSAPHYKIQKLKRIHFDNISIGDTQTMSAKRKYSRHGKRVRYARRGRGACDGIHRCRCGSTQTAFFGLPRIYNGHNLWTAVAWKHAFPRTTPQVGVIGYQHGGGPTGHVFRITSYSGGCNATVTDDAGTHQRNICGRGATFVSVNGSGGGVQTTQAQSRNPRSASKSRKGQYQVAANDTMYYRENNY